MFFFFKQKTAYEMRISDWSSDVCSSDPTSYRISGSKRRSTTLPVCSKAAALMGSAMVTPAPSDTNSKAVENSSHSTATFQRWRLSSKARATRKFVACQRERAMKKSEEHTSELQSLMRISYAVFCL